MIDARARRDRIAQWAFDARPVLGRFHLWLEDVEESRVEGEAHTVPQVIAGAVLGILITTVIFQLSWF